MIKKMRGEWLDHTTGVQPVSDGTMVEVILRDGAVVEGGCEAEHFRWNELNKFDIVKYRVIPDSDGWIENSGVCPVADDVRLDITLDYGVVSYNTIARGWRWGLESGAGANITKWRFAVVEAPRIMSLVEQVAQLQDFKDSLSKENLDLKLQVATLTSKLEQIKGLV